MIGSGFPLMNNVSLGIFYFIMLVYLFLGVGIVSDIFMEAIEEITGQTRIIFFTDNYGNEREMEEVIWNPTVANLTLMALGSSAPEILLSCIETTLNLGSVPGELGPSTIVGSAAFNLLIISAVSIVSVGEEVKKINDLGVFTVTSIASIWAYIWLYIVLSDGVVKIWEALITLVFFVLLIVLAYGADRLKNKFEKEKEG